MSRTIPFDIQLEIIKRLPVKSLIRFISVCKAWKSRIKCPEFVAGYRVLPTQPEHLMIRYEVGDWQEADKEKFVSFVDNDTFPQQKFVPTVPPPILQLFDESIIIGSSCGLLCLDCYFQESDNSTTDMIVVLWNPSIRKAIAVDVPFVVRQPFHSVIGFGVCPDTNDPKLVNITYIHDQRKMESISCIPNQVMVFTLSSREWTAACSNQLPRKSIEFKASHTVIGQFIYWLACDWTLDENFRNLIMSFDMSTEEFREVDLPDSLVDVSEPYIFISRLRESLVLLVYNYEETTNKKVCDVWMMEHGDSKAFTKLFTINAPNASVSRTLGFRKSGEPIVEMESDDRDFYTLVVYEPCSKNIMDLGICGNECPFYGSSYTESLLLLDHGHIVRCTFKVDQSPKDSSAQWRIQDFCQAGARIKTLQIRLMFFS